MQTSCRDEKNAWLRVRGGIQCPSERGVGRGCHLGFLRLLQPQVIQGHAGERVTGRFYSRNGSGVVRGEGLTDPWKKEISPKRRGRGVRPAHPTAVN